MNLGRCLSHAFKSNQIKSLLLSHHHSTSALVSEILMSVLQTVQKKKKKKTTQQTIYIWTDSAKKQQTIYIWTDSAKKLHWSIYSAPDSAKKQQQFTYGQYIFTDFKEINSYVNEQMMSNDVSEQILNIILQFIY